jgi:hypothetical protein
MSSPVPFFYGNPPDDIYSFNVDTLLSSFSQTENFTLHYPVQEQSLASATNPTPATYPFQAFSLDTASQFDWHLPVSAVSQPAFAPALLPVNSGTDSALNQLPENHHSVGSHLRQSQGYIIEHGVQRDSVPPFVNQAPPLQSVHQEEVNQTTDNMYVPWAVEDTAADCSHS